MADLSELIARLEAATEGSRELDGMVGAAVQYSADFPVSRLLRPDLARFEDDSYGNVAVLATSGEGGDYQVVARRPAPHYTTSIDCALTLVPEGHRWLLDKRPNAELRQDGYRCEVYRQGHPYKSDRPDVPQAWAATPALALCIAALKARQS